MPLPLWKVKHAETGSVFPHFIFRGFMDESIKMNAKWNALGISALSAQPFTRFTMRIDFSDRENKNRMSWDGPQVQWMCIPVIRLVVLNMMYTLCILYNHIYIYLSISIYIGIYKGDIAYEPHLITDYWNATPSRMDKNCVFYGSSTANRVCRFASGFLCAMGAMENIGKSSM